MQHDMLELQIFTDLAIVLSMFMLSFTDLAIVLSMFMLSFIDLAIVLSMFMLSFIDPAIILSMLMLSFIFVIVCGLFEWTRICAGFLSFFFLFFSLYIYVQYCDGDTTVKR